MAIDLTGTKNIKLPLKLCINIACGIVFLFTFLILWKILILPKAQASQRLTDQFRSSKIVAKKEISNLNNEKKTLMRNRDLLSKRLFRLEIGLKEKQNISTLLDGLIMTARKRNIEFTYVKPLPQKNIILKDINLHIMQIPVSVELEASFSDFIGFLWETEKMKFNLQVNQISIETNPKNNLKHIEKITVSVFELIS